MSPSTRTSLLVTALSLVLVAAGFWAGRTLSLAGLRRTVAQWHVGERFDFAIGDQAKDAFVRAYEDPEAARRDMGSWSWMPVNTMTPFVMHMPRPGTTANATIGALQCRGKDQPLPGKPRGTLRVLMTGGSTLYGSGAPSDQATIAAFLQGELAADPRLAGRRVEVYAFAVPGWASTHERIAIENRIVDLEPDLVVSFSGANDIRWGTQQRNVLWMRSFSDQHWFDVVNRVLELAGESPLVDVAPPEPVRPPPELVAKRLARNVELAKVALDREKVPYLWVLQPLLQLSRKSLSPRERKWFEEAGEVEYFRACVDAFRARFRELGAALPEVVDLTAVFDDRSAADELFLDSIHFGDRGNRAIARALAPRLAAALAGR